MTLRLAFSHYQRFELTALASATFCSAMAVLLRADGSHILYKEAKPAIADFMSICTVEWHTLSRRQVEASETPWLHENLESDLASKF